MTLHPAATVPLVVSAVAAEKSDQWTVGAYLPLENAAFARVMNPVRSGIVPPVSWASIAGEDLVVDATTQWFDVSGERSRGRPVEGSLDPDVTRSLARILRAHTTTPSDCFLLIWKGYSGIRADLLPAVTIELIPGRSMLVLSGDLDEGSESVEEMPPSRTPQWWIPANGAWTVGNDIYGMSVYVAGTEDAITEIVADETIEAYRVTPSMAIIAEEFEPGT